jgi:hypothetical protein
MLQICINVTHRLGVSEEADGLVEQVSAHVNQVQVLGAVVERQVRPGDQVVPVHLGGVFQIDFAAPAQRVGGSGYFQAPILQVLKFCVLKSLNIFIINFFLLLLQGEVCGAR